MESVSPLILYLILSMDKFAGVAFGLGLVFTLISLVIFFLHYGDEDFDAPCHWRIMCPTIAGIALLFATLLPSTQTAAMIEYQSWQTNMMEALLDRGVIKYTADEKTGETYLIVTETGERLNERE